MSEPNTVVIYGKDYEAPNEIHCQVMADAGIGFGISAGTTSKPNEDCLGISILEGDVLLAIADGHWGRGASELAIQKAVDMFHSTDRLPQENEIGRGSMPCLNRSIVSYLKRRWQIRVPRHRRLRLLFAT